MFTNPQHNHHLLTWCQVVGSIVCKCILAKIEIDMSAKIYCLSIDGISFTKSQKNERITYSNTSPPIKTKQNNLIIIKNISKDKPPYKVALTLILISFQL